MKKKEDINLNTSFCGVGLQNPTVLASGILGTTPDLLKRVARAGAGAVTTKSIGQTSRNGNENPSVLAWDSGLINAVGLPNPGVADFMKKFHDFSPTVPAIVSIFGSSEREVQEVAKKIDKLPFSMIELNISCPNKADGMLFGQDPDSARKLVSVVKSVTKKPVIPKLTPNVTDIVEVAVACQKGGADGLCAINTVSGMIINAEAKRPVLSYRKGGLSGPAIRPIAIRCVYDICSAVKIPVIGTGGISSGRDAVEMLMAGATLVGIGTAAYYRGINVFSKVTAEMRAWMSSHQYRDVKELVGCANEE